MNLERATAFVEVFDADGVRQLEAYGEKPIQRDPSATVATTSLEVPDPWDRPLWSVGGDCGSGGGMRHAFSLSVQVIQAPRKARTIVGWRRTFEKTSRSK
jgi:hypothetical protein